MLILEWTPIFLCTMDIQANSLVQINTIKSKYLYSLHSDVFHYEFVISKQSNLVYFQRPEHLSKLLWNIQNWIKRVKMTYTHVYVYIEQIFELEWVAWMIRIENEKFWLYCCQKFLVETWLLNEIQMNTTLLADLHVLKHGYVYICNV